MHDLRDLNETAPAMPTNPPIASTSTIPPTMAAALAPRVLTLQEHLRAAMSYTEQPAPRCDGCQFYQEEEMMGGSVETCHLNPAADIPVKAHGRCSHFTPKPPRK